MKIAVMGSGGVGGYFGGLLARSGEDVTFIARGAHLDAIRSKGLRVVSDLSGEFVVNSPATDDAREAGIQELILYAVKMYQNAEAISFIEPMVGPETVILTLQNGLDNGDLLADAFGRDRVMVGMCALQGRVREPGVVEQLGNVGRVIFGEMGQGTTPRGESLLKVFEKAGWNVELSDNAMGAIWRKFIYLTGTAGINAVTQAPYGEIRNVAETRELIRGSYQELIDIANALDAPIGDGVMEWAMSSLDEFPSEGMASLAKDFRDGNRVELEGITGTAVRLGKQTGVPTPINSTIYSLLKPAALRIEKALGG